ncbi:MAG: GTPase ObgE [Calditrichia bacterium]
MFIDYAKIYVKGGQGGSGACSFRREKHVPKGGPNGGDGGKGGSIIFEVDPHMRTLVDFKYKRHYVAKHGQHGMGSNKHGRAAADIVVKVPRGTVVKDAETEEILADLITPGERFVAARGGAGGRGNARFATPTNRAPREWEVGEPGEERWLILELKLIADVGLVGFPNAGKSTLLSRVSAAKPKIADYPFTTLQPNLGIVRVDEARSFVMADIPGLIEGAHQGKGLGLQFLRHIERTRTLLYLIDPTVEEPEKTFRVLFNELKEHSEFLVQKPSIVVLTKQDIWEEDYLKKANFSYPVFAISSVRGDGLDELKRQVWERLSKISAESEDDAG